MNSNPASFASTPRRNLAREVLLSLRKEIISGKLQPGTPLSEPVLSRRFSFSRAPIREALIELEREGLVQFETTGRTRVRTLAEKDFDEIVEASEEILGLVALLKSLSPTDSKRDEYEGRLYGALTHLDHHVKPVIKEWDRVVDRMPED